MYAYRRSSAMASENLWERKQFVYACSLDGFVSMYYVLAYFKMQL